jgi:prepilin-type N-terminal cleavage/methylation domain-containing protein
MWLISFDRPASPPMDRALRSGSAGVKTSGFSLIEVLIATAVVTVGVAVVAQIVVAASHANRMAAATAVTVLLAAQRMDTLTGTPVSVPSSPNTLSVSTPGYVDYLDATGVSLDASSVVPPPATAYICRWSIALLPGSASGGVVVQVVVLTWPDFAGQTRLVTVKTRTVN